MIKCPNCSHDNQDGTPICEVCGDLLIEPTTSTKYYDDTDYEEGTPKWGSARFNKKMYLVLDIVDSEKTFTFELTDISEIGIGREDTSTGDTPLVDLSGVHAMEQGVSRNHAKLLLQQGAMLLVDNDSANGTYLNGQKLAARQPRVIRDGDDIRLGHLTIRVSFKEQQ